MKTILPLSRAALLGWVLSLGLSGSLGLLGPLAPVTSLAAQESGQATSQEMQQVQEVREAQQERRVLTIDDYALWRSVGETELSPDGRWVTYAYSRREVDDSLFIESLEGDDRHVVIRGSDPAFSADSRWVAYYIDPPEDDDEDDDEDDEGSGAQRAAELLDLSTGERRRWESVQSFAFADAGNALVVKKRPRDRDADHDGTDAVVRYLDDGSEELLAYVGEWGLDERGGRLAYAIDGPDGEANALYLLDLDDRSRVMLDQEREASYARITWGDDEDEPAADALAALKGEEHDDLVERENALLAWPALSTSTTPIILDPRPEEEDAEDEGSAEEGESPGDPGASGDAEGATTAPDATPAAGGGFPADWVLSEKGGLDWAPDASRIFVATRPQQPAPSTLCEVPDEDDDEGEGGADGGAADEGGAGAAAVGGDEGAGAGDAEGSAASEEDTGPTIVTMATRTGPDGRPLGPEEVMGGTCPEFVADVDIWHVDDERLQSVQRIRADRDRGQTYRSVVHFDGAEAPRFVRLADETMEDLDVSDDGRSAIGRDDRAYRSDWLPSYADYYQVDLETGERTLVLERQLRTLGFDPEGDNWLYWKDGHVWSYRFGEDEHANLTADAPVSFVDEEYDRYGEKPPYGIAGWTEEGDPILEHRYDLWLQPVEGGPPENLTGGVGSEREVRFRILDLDPDEDEIDLDEPLHLTAYGQWTKEDGFYRLDDGELEELVFEDAAFGRPQKADSADVLLWTRETFETFPDYWVSNLDFEEPSRITETNPQQDEYNWGRRILFDYETEDGVRLQGTLAIPYDYEEGERRPMLVNFYEKLSQNLHRYPMPRYASSPNFAGYVSAGYLVMQPDIHFRTGRSHQQMMESIHLALDRVVELGYVDPDRIGLHGHSYSGQGAAYISTRSDRFAAITAGAAATNLVSDFNQLWKSAGTNQHGYDHYGQGRFATNPYDDFELYVDQSAAQNAHLVETPLLLLHGTEDGSVEWLQAVEFYNGLRWNGKDVILLSYPGAGHGLRRYENQKDFQIRMRQFFDHHLRGEPAPRWMEEGRTFIEKERDRAMVDGGNGG